ncbi:Glutathione-independent formaldehyde dehydrogenase [Aquisphaera giovannonii]|uniref:Glutathione-independent formaldehyde dehydrogenase n=1 Tax=Aquisphaera giovannonii TaxID=406548 RepID=A0A5B9W775_9BACT|nr:zinc-dependent alcohol dehydrogenase [Aquisphaera giovannonii]QEH36428.1 Glutathione-independent formaldehyde dehydrogenase [Aquisphaera giovannonii]
MKALCWHGQGHVRIDQVPDAKIEEPRDIVVRITSTAICGSDLHILDGLVPAMERGDILGHEPMGEVVDVGRDIRDVKKGDRVVVPFTISCGSCFFCNRQLYSLCDTTNREPEKARLAMGQAPAGLLGYSHLTGGYPGGQAEYLRVPYADVGVVKVPDGLPDEKVLFLSDILPTAYMAAENCGIEPGDVVAIWGCGPVGQLAIRCAWMLGAGRVVAIDAVPERLRMAEAHGRAEVINFREQDVYARLMEMTKGRGPDRCMDAVGAEAHAAGTLRSALESAEQAVGLAFDRPYVLQEAIRCCRKGGTLSIPGVYIGQSDKIPMGALMNKGLTIKTGQTHMPRYMKMLLGKIEAGEIDPSYIITHRVKLDEAPEAYKTFRDKKDGCIKVVITPGS